MANYKYYESSINDLQNRAMWPIGVALIFVLSSFMLGASAYSFAPIDLQSEVAQTALTFSYSASLQGIVLISVLLIALIVSRKSMSFDYRLKEALAIIGVLILFGGGGAIMNEHWIKNEFAHPRPNIIYLESPETDNALGMTSEEFYLKEHGTQRGRVIYTALSRANLPIDLKVKEHWISETGYTFPSGHSFAAFFITSFFLLFVFTFVDAKRSVVFYILLPWAVMVCLSRVALFVHRPIDVISGAVMGLVVGLLAWYVIRMIIRKLVQAEIKG